jgi:ribonucrease Y
MQQLGLFVLVGIACGFILGYLIRRAQANYLINSAEGKAQRIVGEAKNEQKEILLAAKTKAMEVVEQAKKGEIEFRNQIIKVEQRLDRRETELERKNQELERSVAKIQAQGESLKAREEDIEKVRKQQVEKLEQVAAMSRDDAKKVLMEAVERGVSNDLADLTYKLQNQAHEEAERKARDIVAQAVERCSAEVTTETTTTYVTLPSEEMKGRIIGKEGRNIKAFEQMLGVEVIVDDTPDTVVISGFNSIRRQVAKLTLEKLIKDGRIQPSRIEEAYDKAKKEVAQSIAEAGEQAVYELGITNFPPKLIFLIGRLKYRSSYGQNVLKHSIEMAHLGTVIAKELGADVNIVKQAALLHDIGKALDQDMEGTHVEIGKEIAKKFGLNDKIINAIEAHHEDVAHACIEAAIVDATDNISGSRPGARKESFEQYIKRLEELENIANSFTGVDKTYAIQAGREIRVFVKPEEVDDWTATKLARDIAGKIQAELKYPGEIKVCVIREKRVIEYAR